MIADVLLLVLLAIIVAQVIVHKRRRRNLVPFIVTGGPRPKLLHPGSTTAIWSSTMKQPADTPFPHTPECKTPDAEPQWMALGKGSFERICTCHREVVHWRQRVSRPDPLDPKHQRHGRGCVLLTIPDVAEKPEVYTAWVTLKVEPTYTFATCNSCGHNWYVYDDQSRQRVGATR